MWSPILLLLCTVILQAAAQVTLTGSNTEDVTSTGEDYNTAGVTYASNGRTVTITSTGSDYSRPTDLTSAVSSVANSTGFSNATTTSATQTLLVGGTHTSSSANGTSFSNATSSTTSSAQPRNTVPCNGYPEFCTRSYSNITQVAAHNSPFVRPGNAASNQELDVTTQLNDGIRMLQFQVHDLNGTMTLCHTSCDLLNVGPLETYLATVVQWMRQNPYDVVTLLMGNYDQLKPSRFVPAVENSGLIDYVYTAPTVPMPLDDWPTLGEMILTNQRAVVMLDYQANQESIPWLLDEFSQMWETPFSPTDRDFPCTAQRPPNRPRDVRENRMYMVNHNLNVQIALAGISLDVPAYTTLNETNAVSGYGSLGVNSGNCTEDWNRPPNFLLVDYYNIGNFNGSVFQVAANANGVTYDKSSCCGTGQRKLNSNMAPSRKPVLGGVMAAVLVGIGILLV